MNRYFAGALFGAALFASAGGAQAACTVGTDTVFGCTLSEFLYGWVPTNYASLDFGVTGWLGWKGIIDPVTADYSTANWTAGVTRLASGGYAATGVDFDTDEVITVPVEDAATGLAALFATGLAARLLGRRRATAAAA